MSHFTVAVFSHSPEDVESLLAPFNECVDSASPYAVFEKDEDYDPDETTGERGYWHNPNARWDWFVRGGRWPKFLKLKPDSQEVLNMYYEGHSYDEIAVKMKLKNEGYARRKKYLSKEALMEIVYKDPEYQEFLRYQK